MPLSTTALVSSSTKSGTPSVRSTICAAISSGRALPPVTPAIISARCRGASRLRARKGDVRAADPGRGEFGPEGDDQQDPKHRHPIYDQIIELERGRVAPLRVLEQHQH